ncbi:MAG: PP2C family protein-serine/threonine phosphatase [Planctomycetota bacterium]|jgi:PAS domain S-box-containing protein
MNDINDNALNPGAFLDSLNDGVYAVDTERKIVYWSSAAERITGWRAEDILGKSCFDDVLCHVDKDGHQLCGREHCPLHRAMVTGNGSDVPIIVFALNNNNKRIPMRVSVAPIRNGSGKVIGGIEIFRDASEEHQDVELARRIQSAMLRKQVLQDRRLTFTTYYLPWGMIGGDYYAMERVDQDRFGFILADVSGHGFAAALYTMYLNALWHSHLCLLSQPAELARVMHEKLSKLINNDARFATAILGLFDLKQMNAKLTFAGGPTPLLFSYDGNLQVLEGSGIPLGMPIEAEYKEHIVPVRPGDCLLAFTDGVSEITSENGKLLDIGGLVRILDDIGYPESGDFKALEERLLVYSDRIRFNDDLTILEVRLTNEIES